MAGALDINYFMIEGDNVVGILTVTAAREAV